MLLSGVRVVELAGAFGGVCASVLESFGAEVTRVSAAEAAISLLETADMFIESEGRARFEAKGHQTLEPIARGRADPARLATLEATGASLDAIRERNPGLIHCSITAFGSRGPRAQFRGGELVCAALGGVLRLVGDPGRAPVKEALDACVFHAEAAAAAAILIAWCERSASGLGQHVDVSIQEVAASRLTNCVLLWQFDRRQLERSGVQLRYGRAAVRCIWQLADGYAFHTLMSGRFGAPANAALSAWMDEVSGDNPLRGVDWLAYDRSAVPADTRAVWEAAIDRFFRTRTKHEIASDGRRRGINAAVVQEPSDVLADPQLAARGFWVAQEIEGHVVQVPGPYVRVVEASNENERGAAAGDVPPVQSSPDVLTDPQSAAPGASASHAMEVVQMPEARARSSPGLARVLSRGIDAASMQEASHAAALTRPSGTPAPRGPAALSGVRVLDFSWALVGSLTTKALGDYGACVVKVESAARACLTRLDVQVARSTRSSLDDKPWFAHLNTSKRSLNLDLKHPRAREVLDPLIDWADVVVENFSPGTLQKLELDYETLKRRRPDLIMVSASAYGQTGPLAQSWGVDGTSAAMSSRTWLTGWGDGFPLTPGAVPYADVVVPQFMVAAIGAALARKRRSGQGCYVDASMYEISVHQMRRAVIDAQLGRPHVRNGNRDREVWHQGVYPARGVDRWIAISLFGRDDYQRLITLLGGEWPAAAAVEGAVDEARDAFDSQLAERTSQRGDFEWMAQLQAAGIAAGVVQDVADVLERDPQLRARPAWVALDHAVLGAFEHQSVPYHLARTPAEPTPAPRIGEHTEHVCRELLGLREQHLRELFEAGVVVLAGAGKPA
jgi:crotonobetainyl-CoA:carnitine CoA-transferase CaiB-like acyl-CoA transferase